MKGRDSGAGHVAHYAATQNGWSKNYAATTSFEFVVDMTPDQQFIAADHMLAADRAMDEVGNAPPSLIARFDTQLGRVCAIRRHAMLESTADDLYTSDTAFSENYYMQRPVPGSSYAADCDDPSWDGALEEWRRIVGVSRGRGPLPYQWRDEPPHPRRLTAIVHPQRRLTAQVRFGDGDQEERAKVDRMLAIASGTSAGSMWLESTEKINAQIRALDLKLERQVIRAAQTS